MAEFGSINIKEWTKVHFKVNESLSRVNRPPPPIKKKKKKEFRKISFSHTTWPHCFLYPFHWVTYCSSSNCCSPVWSIDESELKLQPSHFSPVTTTVLLPGGLGIYPQFRPRRGSLDRNIPSFQTAVPGSQPDSCLVFPSVYWLSKHGLNPLQWNKVLFIYFIWTYLFHLGFMPFWFHETGGPGMRKCNPLTIILLFVPGC